MVHVERILCAVDFSDFSRDALRHGVRLATWYSAQLTVLHVYQPVGAVRGSVREGVAARLFPDR
jgi:nucleotide-binding universal stress UspA family protein